MWEQQHIADRGRIGQKHHQPIDAQTEPGRRRHAIFERAHVVGIVVHGLGVAAILELYLGAESLRLVLGVVELGKAVGKLAPGKEELEAVGDERIGVVAAR